jgi:CheY-like chemotaxis protein
LETVHPKGKPRQHDPYVHDLASNFEEAEQSVVAVRKFADGKVIDLRRPASRKKEGAAGEPPTLDVVEQYLTHWLGLTVLTFSDSKKTYLKVDLIIADEEDSWPGPSPGPGTPLIFLICHSRISLQARKCQAHPGITGFITGPVGPYKLAHSLLAHFRGPEEVGTPATIPSADETNNKRTSVQESGKITNLPLRLKGQEVTNSASPNGSTEDLNNSPPLRKPSTKNSQRPTSSGGLVPSANKRDPSPPPLFPAPPSSKRRPRPQQRPSQPTNSRPLRILVVDDNEINLQLLQRYLAKRKADTIGTAGNGIEAVAAFKEAVASENPYDLIFMDLSMPLMDGFEATRMIRQFEAKGLGAGVGSGAKGGREYIVALTGLAAMRDREEAANSGVDDFMTKPVSFVKVGKLLGERSTVGVDGDEKGIGDGAQNGDVIEEKGAQG